MKTEKELREMLEEEEKIELIDLKLREKAEKWDKISAAMKQTISDIRSQKKPVNAVQLAVHHILTAYLQGVGEDLQDIGETPT